MRTIDFTANSSENVARWVMAHLQEDSCFSESEQSYLRTIKNNLQGWDEGKKIQKWSERFVKVEESLKKLHHISSDSQKAKEAVNELIKGMFDKSTYYKKKMRTDMNFAQAIDDIHIMNNTISQQNDIIQNKQTIEQQLTISQPIVSQPLTTKKRFIHSYIKPKLTTPAPLMVRNPKYPIPVPKREESHFTKVKIQIGTKIKKIKDYLSTIPKKTLLATLLFVPVTPLSQGSQLEQKIEYELPSQTVQKERVSSQTTKSQPAVSNPVQPFTFSYPVNPSTIYFNQNYLFNIFTKPTTNASEEDSQSNQSLEKKLLNSPIETVSQTSVNQVKKNTYESQNPQQFNTEQELISEDPKTQQYLKEMIQSIQKRNKEHEQPAVKIPTFEEKVDNVARLIQDNVRGYLSNHNGYQSTVFSQNITDNLIRNQHGFTEDFSMPTRLSNLTQLYIHLNQKTRSQRFEKYSHDEIDSQKLELYKIQVRQVVKDISQRLTNDPAQQEYVTNRLLPLGEMSVLQKALALSFSGREPKIE